MTSPEDLTIEDVSNRLQLKSHLVIDDIYAMIIRLYQAEEQRLARLDGKAQGVLASAGLSMTLILFLTKEHIDSIRRQGSSADIGDLLFWSLALAFIMGIVCAGLSLVALLTRSTNSNPNEREILNIETLKTADEACLKDDGSIDNNEKMALAIHRRHITAHYWKLWKNLYRANNTKGRWLRRAQMLFMAFIVAMMSMGASALFALW